MKGGDFMAKKKMVDPFDPQEEGYDETFGRVPPTEKEVEKKVKPEVKEVEEVKEKK